MDFYSPRLRLAIEIDGPSHESQEERERDKNRQEIIEQCGIRFLRFTNEEVMTDPERVLKAIENFIIDHPPH